MKVVALHLLLHLLLLRLDLSLAIQCYQCAATEGHNCPQVRSYYSSSDLATISL